MADGSLVWDDPALVDWEDLAETLRASNRDQAIDIGRKLESIGCEVVPVNQAEAVTEFDSDEIEALAHLEHVRWVEDRLRHGWQPGAVRDPTNKRTPYLVPWSELSEELRDLDRDSVRAIPRLLAESGLSIVRRRGVEGR